MGKIIKLYNTWEKAKDYFIRPSLRVYFGPWRKDPSLPIWRRGPAIYIPRRKGLYNRAYPVKDSVMIKTGVKTWEYNGETLSYNCYDWAPSHKLPGNLKAGDYVWKRSIRKKLKKWHLSWIKPVIHLPVWMRFTIFNHDVLYKWKYDSIRYEYPPQFTIVAFGLSLSFTLHSPVQNALACDDHYWESLLNHVYDNNSGTLKETILNAGIWSRYKDDKKIDYFALRPSYLKTNRLAEYYATISSIKSQKNQAIQ